jgi:hypothetical protein
MAGNGVPYFSISVSDRRSKTRVIPRSLNCILPKQNARTKSCYQNVCERMDAPFLVIAAISAERRTKFGLVTLPREEGYEPRSRMLCTPSICTKGGLDKTFATYPGSNGPKSMMEVMSQIYRCHYCHTYLSPKAALGQAFSCLIAANCNRVQNDGYRRFFISSRATLISTTK